MKILKAVLLTLLISLCGIAAVVTFIHIRSVNDSDDAQISDHNASSDISEPGTAIAGNADSSMFQSALVKPEDSDFWHFYPTIPDDAVPGDTVVLSAFAQGFLGWEVNGDFADVDLFGQSSDGGLEYISFIMPDDKVAVRALYENILFSDDTIYVQSEPLEYGDASGMQPFNISWPSIPTMRIGMVGVQYNQTITLPSTPAPGFSWVDDPPAVRDGWIFNFNTGQIQSADNEVPPDPAPPAVPTPPTGITFDFRIWTTTPGEAPEDPPVYSELPYPITIIILPRMTFPQPVLYDGVVGVQYSAQIESDNTLPGSLWWGLAAGSLPPGLNLNNNTGAITGNPTADGEYNFTLEITALDPDISASLQQEFTITIWKRPVITPRSDIPDGMVGQPYIYGNIIEVTDAPVNPAVSPWNVSVPGLPSGMSFDYSSADELKLINTPTEAGERSFYVNFTRKDDSNPNIPNMSESFDIKIWPRPIIDTPARLGDGMVGKGSYKSGEPLDDDYKEVIAAHHPDGTPTGTTWAWSEETPGDLPDELIFTPSNSTISGPLTTAGDYSTTIRWTASSSNLNIHGAYEEETFLIRVWNRTYLSIDMFPTAPPTAPGTVLRLEPTPELNGQFFERAVMPDTWGEIYAFLGWDGFVRWETTCDKVTVGNNHSYRDIQVGGSPTRIAWVHIQMPTVNYSTPVPDPGVLDVKIYGTQAPRPTISPNPLTLLQGRVGDGYSGALTTSNVGSGYNPSQRLVWDISGDDAAGYWPDGLHLDTSTGVISGVPTEKNIITNPPESRRFDFVVGLTLPGSMRITNNDPFFTNPATFIIINPRRPDLGDVNGDRVVNLADLLLLIEYFQKPVSQRPVINLDNSNIKNNGLPLGPGEEITTYDLFLLSQFFARPGGFGP